MTPKANLLKMIKQLRSPKCCFYFAVTILLTFLSGANTQAARYITVATIGTRAFSISSSSNGQVMVDQMIEFYKSELRQVLPDKPDLILFPEGSDIPRDLTPEARKAYASAKKNQIQDYLASVARDNNCYIAFGSMRQVENGKYNSLVILNRKGEVEGIYNKNYPTIGEIEGGILPGTEAPIIRCDFGTVACVICFDLNFEELRLRYVKEKPDLILVASMFHGGLAQDSWAFSCQSHMVGSMGFREIPSQIKNPFGEVLGSSTNYFDYAVARINLDCQLVHLDENWNKLKQLKARYGPDVIIHDPGQVGSVLITSEHKSVTVDQMIKEFDIEKLEDYIDRSSQFRMDHIRK